MADQLSLRGGTTTEHATFTGANKEVTVDTTKKTLVVNDGATVGGHPLMRENASNSALALGSAATPSLKFTGDINTGIYSPGADQVAISTNGTEKLIVKSDGKVGIGTSSPNYEVHVNASDATNFIQLTNSGTGTGASDGLLLYNNGVNATVSNQEAGYLSLETSGQARLHILSDGKVGINTASPVSTLNVSVADNGNITISNTNDGHTGGLAFGDTSSNLSGQISYDHSNNSMRFYTAGSERVRITSNGVGIGITNPGSALEINAAAATSPFIAKINTAEVARIDSSGRLLVGTSSDSGGALFQVNGDRIRVGTAKTPASASAAGTTGEIAWDANYIYVCTATNTWKRTAIATW